jgi:alkylation response protein AidB-like acyl-CoA dehydrogenase
MGCERIRLVASDVGTKAQRLADRGAGCLEHAPSTSLDPATTKPFVSESLRPATLGTVQRHGGYGLTSEYEVLRALRDAMGSTLR